LNYILHCNLFFILSFIFLFYFYSIQTDLLNKIWWSLYSSELTTQIIYSCWILLYPIPYSITKTLSQKLISNLLKPESLTISQQHLTFLSPTNSNPGKYKQIRMNTDKSRKIQKNTEYPQNHQKHNIIRKAKNI
jgi:hypothetical protein